MMSFHGNGNWRWHHVIAIMSLINLLCVWIKQHLSTSCLMISSDFKSNVITTVAPGNFAKAERIVSGLVQHTSRPRHPHSQRTFEMTFFFFEFFFLFLIELNAKTEPLKCFIPFVCQSRRLVRQGWRRVMKLPSQCVLNRIKLSWPHVRVVSRDIMFMFWRSLVMCVVHKWAWQRYCSPNKIY